MNLKITLAMLALVVGLAITGGNTLPVFANHPDHPSSNQGLDNADERIHNQGPGFLSEEDVQFHTGTGQGGFCVSDV
jgi:hypothetical protein